MAPVAQLVRLDVAEDQRSAVASRLAANIAGSRREPGCIVFQGGESRTEPGVFFVWEVFASQADLDAHYRTPHFNAWKTWLDGLEEGAVVRTRLPLDLLD